MTLILLQKLFVSPSLRVRQRCHLQR